MPVDPIDLTSLFDESCEALREDEDDSARLRSRRLSDILDSGARIDREIRELTRLAQFKHTGTREHFLWGLKVGYEMGRRAAGVEQLEKMCGLGPEEG